MHKTFYLNVSKLPKACSFTLWNPRTYIAIQENNLMDEDHLVAC